jgi:hypothetical protein
VAVAKVWKGTKMPVISADFAPSIGKKFDYDGAKLSGYRLLQQPHQLYNNLSLISTRF